MRRPSSAPLGSVACEAAAGDHVGIAVAVEVEEVDVSAAGAVGFGGAEATTVTENVPDRAAFVELPVLTMPWPPPKVVPSGRSAMQAPSRVEPIRPADTKALSERARQREGAAPDPAADSESQPADCRSGSAACRRTA